MSLKRLRTLRILSQTLFLILFITLFYLSGSVEKTGQLNRYYFYTDPLHFIISVIASGLVVSWFLLALVTIVLSLLLGRFFCGWICPMGAVHQFFSRILKPFRRGPVKPLSSAARSVKYLILIVVLLLSTVGSNLAGWFDPLSFMSRSLANWHRTGVLLLFFGIILLNIRYHRFYCHVLCPLGALLSLLSRTKRLRWVLSDACTDCGICTNTCEGGFDPASEKRSMECLLCMNCASSCIKDGIQLKFVKNLGKNESGYLPTRRLVITSLVSSAAWVLLPKISKATDNRSRNMIVRPPGALAEPEFLNRCSRCGQCIQGCPTHFIQLAGPEQGIEELWTPVCDAEIGGCKWECTQCMKVCPTGALKNMELAEKQRFKIGTAIINRSTCYTHADGFNCTACADTCPLPQKAIVFKESEVFDYRGDTSRVRKAYVLPELCTGCGLCVSVCPRPDHPAISITPADEVRAEISA